MRYITVLLCWLGSLAASGQAAPVAFVEGDWEQTLVEAQKARKPVFLYAWSLSCGPCRTMARDVFPDSAVGRYYNATFVNYKVNIDQGAGREIAKRYAITSLPTYLYFDAQGQLLHRSGSGKPAAAFIQDGRDAFNPQKAYYSLKAQYEAGERGAQFLYAFATSSAIWQEEALNNQVAADYFKSQSANELVSPKNLAYLFEASTGFDSPATQYYLSHQSVFRARYGAAEVQRKTRRIISWEAMQASSKSNSVALSELQAAIGRVLPGEAAQWQALANLSYLLGQPTRNWPAYADAALAYGQQYAAQDSYPLYEAAMYLEVFVADKLLLRKADQLIQQAIAVDKSYTNLLLRAKLLRKLGDATQAAAVAQVAVQVAATTHEPVEEATELLASLKAKKG